MGYVHHTCHHHPTPVDRHSDYGPDRPTAATHQSADVIEAAGRCQLDKGDATAPAGANGDSAASEWPCCLLLLFAAFLSASSSFRAAVLHIGWTLWISRHKSAAHPCSAILSFRVALALLVPHPSCLAWMAHTSLSNPSRQERGKKKDFFFY